MAGINMNEQENIPNGDYSGGVPNTVSPPDGAWELAISYSLGVGWPWHRPGLTPTNVLRRTAENRWKEANV